MHVECNVLQLMFIINRFDERRGGGRPPQGGYQQQAPPPHNTSPQANGYGPPV